MSKLQELGRNVKVISDLLKKVSDDLLQISKDLQTLPKPNITVETVKAQFTKKQNEFIRVEETNSDILVLFTKYMPEGFGDLANRVEGMGGKYFKKTEHREAHFKIPK